MEFGRHLLGDDVSKLAFCRDQAGPPDEQAMAMGRLSAKAASKPTVTCSIHASRCPHEMAKTGGDTSPMSFDRFV